MSKRKGNQRQTKYIGRSAGWIIEQLQRRDLPAQERRDLVREAKVRKIRNKQKRQK